MLTVIDTNTEEYIENTSQDTCNDDGESNSEQEDTCSNDDSEYVPDESSVSSMESNSRMSYANVDNSMDEFAELDHYSEPYPASSRAILSEDLHNLGQVHAEDECVRAYRHIELDAEVVTTVQNEFVKCGLLRHLKFKGRGTQYCMTALRQVGRFLLWAHLAVKDRPLKPCKLLKWMKTLMAHHHQYFHEYAIFMESELHALPATIKNHFTEIRAAFSWLLLVAPVTKSIKDIELLKPVDAVIDLVQSNMAKKNRLHKRKLTMENKVNALQMPADGLQELIKIVDRAIHDLDCWMTILRQEAVPRFSQAEYDQFMRTLYASLYVYGVNGRIGGLMQLTYKELDKLLTQGFGTVDTFKTAATHRFQYVQISEYNRPLMEFYGKVLRPQVRAGIPRAEEPLWLQFNGEPEARIGHRVADFFKLSANLKVTTTSIRSLMETAADKLYQSGDISEVDKKAVTKLNGHSSTIAENHYIHRDQVQCVAQSRTVVEKVISKLQTSNPLTHVASVNRTAEASTFRSMIPSETVYKRPVYGTAHPMFGVKTKKVRWTDDEIAYIDKFYARLVQAGDRLTTVAARCLDQIRQDEYAISIFHENHVVDSARLSHGVKQVKPKYESNYSLDTD